MGKLGKFIKAYLISEAVRDSVGTLASVVFSGIYVIFNVVTGVIYENPLFVGVAAYYTVVLFLRYSVIEASSATDAAFSYKASRDAGILVLIIAVPMMGIIAYSAITQRSAVYSGIVLPILALYTFFSLFRALFKALRSKRIEGVRDKAVNRISLTATLISVFNLQSALLSSLGLSEYLTVSLNLFSGIILTVLVISLATLAVRECEDALRKH